MEHATTSIPHKRLIALSVLTSVFFTVGILAILSIAFRQPLHTKPVDVARNYFLADYARNYHMAWEIISDKDKAFKTLNQYLSENFLPMGSQSQLFEQLTKQVEFSPLTIVSSRLEQTVVWARVRYPDLNSPIITPLLESAVSPDADIKALKEQVQMLSDAGQLPFIEKETSFNLVDDDGFWRVVLHWDGAITIRLFADVHDDLPWDFYPAGPEIQVMPGETVRTSYIARNNSNTPITGKAFHEILPLENRMYLETVQCFCFTEQTLEAGEEREMTLIFRVAFTIPQGIHEFRNSYTFYTLETFPEMEEA